MHTEDLKMSWRQTPDIRLVVGASGVIEEANPAAQGAGLTAGLDLTLIISGPTRSRIARLLQRTPSRRSASAELSLPLNGKDRVFLVQALPLAAGRVEMSGRDVTRLRNRDLQNHPQIGRDALTGLPDRAVLHDRMEQALRRAQRAGGGVGLMFLDADRFKDINDQYGHEFGDVVLRGIANRVQSVLRDSDTMVRLGGDEFVVVCEDVANAIALDALAARVALAVSAEPFVSVGASAMVTCSVGVAYADPENLDIELFLRSADGAMYDAKRAGRGRQRRVIVDGRPDRMVAGVRRAIERGTLPMALQPIRDPRTGVDIGWAVDVALESRPRTLSALHALSADPATMRAFAGLAIRHAVNVAHLQPAGVLQVHVPLIALADAGVRESLLAEIEASGVPIDRFAFAVDAMGVRSERTLLSVHEKTDGRLRFALLRFGAESLDLGALVELHPDVCEVDAEMVTGARQDERLNATCAVAHAIGARSQVQGLALGSDVPGIDQVRAPAGEKLQWLDPLPIGR